MADSCSVANRLDVADERSWRRAAHRSVAPTAYERDANLSILFRLISMFLFFMIIIIFWFTSTVPVSLLRQSTLYSTKCDDLFTLATFARLWSVLTINATYIAPQSRFQDYFSRIVAAARSADRPLPVSVEKRSKHTHTRRKKTKQNKYLFATHWNLGSVIFTQLLLIFFQIVSALRPITTQLQAHRRAVESAVGAALFSKQSGELAYMLIVGEKKQTNVVCSD